MDGLVSILTQDAVMNMPPWVYWLDGRDAIAATITSTGTWEGVPRPGRYRIVATERAARRARLRPDGRRTLGSGVYDGHDARRGRLHLRDGRLRLASSLRDVGSSPVARVTINLDGARREGPKRDV